MLLKIFYKNPVYFFIVHVMVNVTRINTINFEINFSYISLLTPIRNEMIPQFIANRFQFTCNYHLWKKIVFLENRNLNQCRKLFLTIDIAFHLRSILSMTLAIGKDFPRISRATYQFETIRKSGKDKTALFELFQQKENKVRTALLATFPCFKTNKHCFVSHNARHFV